MSENKNDIDDVVQVDILDVLLEDENCAPIIMYNDKGECLKFDQIAVIPYGEDDLYCILKPITKISGIKEDEAIVFQVLQDEESGMGYLKVEESKKISMEIFEQYYDLIEKM